MSTQVPVLMRCSRCGHEYTIQVWRHIDAVGDSQLKERVKSGSIFVRECPECGNRELVLSPVIYRDEHLLLCLSDRPLQVEGLDGVAGRQVSDVGSFIEKVKIFDAGLDDVTMELCKYVTRQELNKDVELKFLKTDGADNDIVFTYPENGQMQMLAVGFNVYEDARGILSRNPAIRPEPGFALVDQAWLEGFFA